MLDGLARWERWRQYSASRGIGGCTKRDSAALLLNCQRGLVWLQSRDSTDSLW